MTYRWTLAFVRLFALVFCFSFPSQGLWAAKLDAYLLVKWEGRELEEPNLEALDAFRKKFPEIPFIHLINPSYFKEVSKVSSDNFEAISQRIADSDEVGLYLAPSASLVKAADVLLMKKPTFWSYSDEVCSSDCGLAVPMTVYNRDDVVKLVYTAHSIMKEFGFSDMQSFAVHGFIQPANVQSVADSLAYTNDLTAIDKGLVRDRLKEFPIGQWLESSQVPAAPEPMIAWTQSGGLIEFNSDEEILKRFKSFFSEVQDPRSAFILSVSQENIFMNSLRLERSIQGMKDEAEARGDQLVFEVMTKGKKGRPVAKNKAISKDL